MGSFRETITLQPSVDGKTVQVEALVDTGATYTWIRESILHELGVEPQLRQPFIMADMRQVEKDMATVIVSIGDKQRYTPVIFGDDGSVPLLGVVTLEEFGLGVDPVNRRLVEMPGLLMRCEPVLGALPCPDRCEICRQTIRKREIAFLGQSHRIRNVASPTGSPADYRSCQTSP